MTADGRLIALGRPFGCGQRTGTMISRMREIVSDLGVPLAETVWRNGDPDADGKAPFGFGDHLAGVAWHHAPLFLVCGRGNPGEP
jgi:hypothetical protein